MTALARTAAAAIAVVACLGPAPALAQWEAPVTVSEPIAFAETPSLAAGADGRVLLTYGFRQPSGLLGVTAVSRRPDGRWGPRRAWGIALTSAGPAPRRAGIGEGLSSIAPYGPDRGGAAPGRLSGRRQVLEWWRGTTAGGLRRGGALAPEPWEAGQVAARPDGVRRRGLDDDAASSRRPRRPPAPRRRAGAARGRRPRLRSRTADLPVAAATAVRARPRPGAVGHRGGRRVRGTADRGRGLASRGRAGGPDLAG